MKNILKSQHFIMQMNKYLLNVHYLNLLSKKGNLTEKIIEIQEKQFFNFLNEKLIDSNKFWVDKEISKKEKKEASEKIYENAVNNIKKESIEIFPILFSQAYVMIFAVLDSFLYHSIKQIFIKEPSLSVKFISKKRRRKLNIKKNSEQNNFFYIKKEALKGIYRAGVNQKFNDLKEKLKIDLKYVLNFFNHYDYIQEKFKGDMEKLDKFCKDRHDIVHRNKIIIKDYQDLSYRCEYFKVLIMSLSLEIQKVYKITLDIQEMYIKSTNSMKS
jgi:hypothetical protein